MLLAWLLHSGNEPTARKKKTNAFSSQKWISNSYKSSNKVMIHIPLNNSMLLVTSTNQIFADIYAWFISLFPLQYWYLRHGKNCKEGQEHSPLLGV